MNPYRLPPAPERRALAELVDDAAVFGVALLVALAIGFRAVLEQR